jgi:hypothetical protein
MARATRSPAGARRSTVMATAMIAIARRNEEDHHETGATADAVGAEAQAVLPRRVGVGRQSAAAPGCFPAAGKMTRLPRGELEATSDHDDHTDRDGHRACQRVVFRFRQNLALLQPRLNIFLDYLDELGIRRYPILVVAYTSHEERWSRIVPPLTDFAMKLGAASSSIRSPQRLWPGPPRRPPSAGQD